MQCSGLVRMRAPRQEGGGREVQPADGSATTNGTDVTNRASGAGAPSALEGAQSRAGNVNTGKEPEAGSQGTKRRSVRACLSGMGGEGSGVRMEARTYVRTGGGVIKEMKMGHRLRSGEGQGADSRETEVKTVKNRNPKIQK